MKAEPAGDAGEPLRAIERALHARVADRMGFFIDEYMRAASGAAFPRSKRLVASGGQRNGHRQLRLPHDDVDPLAIEIDVSPGEPKQIAPAESRFHGDDEQQLDVAETRERIASGIAVGADARAEATRRW